MSTAQATPSHGIAARPTPVGGPILTRPFKVLMVFGILGIALTIWRFAVGLGPATALSDGYPWGLWIAFDVVTGTALACGGYAMAILVYILNKGRYHALVRPAVLTSALGYSLAGLAIAIDVGRPWLIWRVPLGGFPAVGFNWNSALLEVALCVMAYVVVLWIEMAPVFLDRWQESPRQGLARFARKTLPFFDKALPWILALGLLLPTMHQSSLGTVMLLSGPRLHPLWNTPWVPMLFLVSCIAMGYATVVLESSLAAAFFRRQRETKMLASLSTAIAVVLALYLVLRLGDIIFRGQLGAAFAFDLASFWFWVEIFLFAFPLGMILSARSQLENAGYLFRIALLIALAGAFYRFATYLIAFQPGAHYSYFPAVPEILITLGLVALEVMAYIYFVKRFPILGGARTAASA